MYDKFHHFWELLWSMTEKELRARYKHTLFGFLWMIINPILQMLAIGFIFTFFMKEPIPYYYYHLFIGLLVWNFFSLTLSKTTPSIVFERALIKKSRFPRAVIPLSIVLSNFIHLVLAFIFFLIPVSLLGTLSVGSFLYLFIACCLLIIFTIGLSLLTSALNVRFRDVSFFVQAALVLWFYATPVVYSLTQMPRHLIWLWHFNPISSILQMIRHGLLGAHAPETAMLMINISIITTVMILGALVFQHESKTFDDWV